MWNLGLSHLILGKGAATHSGLSAAIQARDNRMSAAVSAYIYFFSLYTSVLFYFISTKNELVRRAVKRKRSLKPS